MYVAEVKDSAGNLTGRYAVFNSDGNIISGQFDNMPNAEAHLKELESKLKPPRHKHSP